MNYLPAALKYLYRMKVKFFVQSLCGESGSFIHFVIVSSITGNNRETPPCGLIPDQFCCRTCLFPVSV